MLIYFEKYPPNFISFQRNRFLFLRMDADRNKQKHNSIKTLGPNIARQTKLKKRCLTSSKSCDISKVHCTPNRGVQVTDEEIETAFQFFDTEGRGLITANAIKDRLDMFKDKINLNEVHNLLNRTDGISLDDVKKFIKNNDLNHFDPFEEVFEAFDPSGSGFIDTDILQNLFRALNFGFNEEDINFIVGLFDQNNNGKIGKEEFRNIFNGKT